MRHVFPFLALSGWLAAGLSAVVLPSLDPVPSLDPAAQHPSVRVRDLLRRVNTLTLARAEAEETATYERWRREQAEAQSKNLRQGLERAVDELNDRPRTRLGAARRLVGNAPGIVSAGRTAASTGASSPRRRPSGPKRLQVQPTLHVVGDVLWVKGRIENRYAREIGGSLFIELNRDGRSFGTAGRRLRIHPGGGADFEQKFYIAGFRNGAYTATASFLFE